MLLQETREQELQALGTNSDNATGICDKVVCVCVCVCVRACRCACLPYIACS